LRDLDRDEFEEVKGNKVVVKEMVSDDLGEVVAGFKEKREIVLIAMVKDAMIGNKKMLVLRIW